MIVDEQRDRRQARGPVEAGGKPDDRRDDQDLPDLDAVGGDKRRQHQDRQPLGCLDGLEHPAAIDPIEHRAGDRRGDQHRGGVGKADEAEEEFIVGQVIDQIAQGGDPHPDSGQRRDEARPEPGERARAKGRQRAGPPPGGHLASWLLTVTGFAAGARVGVVYLRVDLYRARQVRGPVLLTLGPCPVLPCSHCASCQKTRWPSCPTRRCR